MGTLLADPLTADPTAIDWATFGSYSAANHQRQWASMYARARFLLAQWEPLVAEIEARGEK